MNPVADGGHGTSSGDAGILPRGERALRGVVLSGAGGLWRVHVEDGRTLEAVLRGRLKLPEDASAAAAEPARPARRGPASLRRAPEAPRAAKLSVGDDVLVEPDTRGGAWAISEILPRRSRLARRAPGGGFGERIVAANVDQVVIVFAAAKPEPHPRMLDRFLVIAEANELTARIIINKVDLVGESAVHERFDDYARAGYPVHLASVKRGEGLETVRAMLGQRVSVFTGPSGVGKSSLLNALFPGLALRVGEISASVNKGRHTTVGAAMVPLPEGGYVVDTPGLREVGMWALPPEHLDACFPEMRPYLGQCRFADCTHTVEPGCAVLDAIHEGKIGRARYDSYVKLRDELEESDFSTW